eukprot:TRINITY_DN109_c0_g1_i7.p1 TRINITY_DN109_c0_g1~~TRINITY_DN109_c0_g1_i7.p1  ORF type:complete len:223 (-),score=26.47 TRINITY_DN109_c0_g1_i7:96-764(-)
MAVLLYTAFLLPIVLGGPSHCGSAVGDLNNVECDQVLKVLGKSGGPHVCGLSFVCANGNIIGPFGSNECEGPVDKSLTCESGIKWLQPEYANVSGNYVLVGLDVRCARGNEGDKWQGTIPATEKTCQKLQCPAATWKTVAGVQFYSQNNSVILNVKGVTCGVRPESTPPPQITTSTLPPTSTSTPQPTETTTLSPTQTPGVQETTPAPTETPGEGSFVPGSG